MMSTFYEYMIKDGSLISTFVIFFGIVVIIASAVGFSHYLPNPIPQIAGILCGVFIIVLGGKYAHFRKEENKQNK